MNGMNLIWIWFALKINILGKISSNYPNNLFGIGVYKPQESRWNCWISLLTRL